MPSVRRASTLELALGYLTRHPNRFLFPIAPGKKFPPCVKDNLDRNSSNDPAQIRKWHARWFGCNWGLAHAKSRVMVVDVDCNKKKGKVGRNTFDTLAMLYDWPDTETTTTPSGGFHLVYEGEHVMALGENGLGKDIDSPNYTLIAGCTFDNGTTYKGNEAASVPCPSWIYDEIKGAKAKNKARLANAGDIVVELDQPANVGLAIDFLKSDAEPAIEGSGGDFTTLKTGMYLKDLGISPALALDLMLEHYNPRCEPAWDRDDLERKVANAYNYSSLSKTGGKTAEADFTDDPPPTITPMGNTKKIAREKRDREKAQRREAAKAESEKAYLPTQDQVIDAYVYVTGSDLFVAKDMPPPMPNGYHPPREMLRAVAFDRKFMYLTPKKGKLSENLLRMKRGGIARASQLVYRPDIPSKFFRVGNESFLNLYVPSPIKPAFDANNTEALNALALWDAHLEYLFPDQGSRDHVLNWMAWLLQNMEKKPKFALIMQGPRHGTGKSFVAQMLKAIVGSYNTSRVTAKMLGSTFNQYAQNAKLIIVEELRAVDKREVKETLHDMISEDEISINSKNEKLVTMLNCFGIFAMTNVDAALTIDNDDRRYLIVKTEAIPQPDAYYAKLYALFSSKVAIAAIAYSLKSRNLNGYNGQGRAPMTAAKADMISAGGSPLEHWMMDHAGDWPLCARLTTIDEIINTLPRRFIYGGTDQAVANVLKSAFNGVPIRLPVNKSKKSLWAINAHVEITALLRSREAAIENKDAPKIESRNASLAEIYLADKARVTAGRPLDAYDDDDGTEAAEDFRAPSVAPSDPYADLM